MQPYAEAIIGAIAFVGALVAAWINLAQRVAVLERAVQDYFQDRTAQRDRFGESLARLEDKVDRLALRCAAFTTHHGADHHHSHPTHGDFPLAPRSEKDAIP